jgi:membrane protein implicated in regulation of membrane protease activity
VNHIDNEVKPGSRPTDNKALLTVASALLATPIVALLWVGSYARVEPTLAGFPFFIWYQFVWVFLCAACTLAAHHIVLRARPRRRFSQRETTDKDTGR